MAQLGRPVPDVVQDIRRQLSPILAENDYRIVDADSVTTGKDFLFKIWQLAVAVPLGIAIIHEGIAPTTLANVFYELGWMQAYGKETLVIRAGDISIPSDFVRTEHVVYDEGFERRVRSFLRQLNELADYFSDVSAQLERNPLLAIDYLRRAFLLTGDDALRVNANEIAASAGLEDRAKKQRGDAAHQLLNSMLISGSRNTTS